MIVFRYVVTVFRYVVTVYRYGVTQSVQICCDCIQML